MDFFHSNLCLHYKTNKKTPTMKFASNNSQVISRRNFKFFMLVLISGTLLTWFMVSGLQAQTMAMVTSHHTSEVNKKSSIHKMSSFERGIAAVNENDDHAAVGFFSAALLETQPQAGIYYTRGCAYARLKNWKKAISDFSFAIDMDSTQADYYYHRALAANKAGKYTAAISDCNRVIQLNNQKAEAYLLRGISKALKSDDNNSMNDFRMAVSIKPDYAEAYYNIGLNFYETNDFENAKKNLEHAKSLGFENRELTAIVERQSGNFVD